MIFWGTRVCENKNENGPYSLIYLNVWTTVTENCLGRISRCVLVSRVWPCWRRWITGGGLWGIKSSNHSQLVHTLFLSPPSLPCACGSDVRSQPLLQSHARLLPCFLSWWPWTLLPSGTMSLKLNAFICTLPWTWCLYTATEK